MRLISLSAENFLKFQQISLEFPDGLTGILGPNGVGKSSLVEAVAWALYGSPVSRTRNEGIPFRGNKPCRVHLALEIDGEEYHVTRELRGQNCVAYAEVQRGQGIAEAKGAERATDFMTRLLRMDHRAFLVSFFARQKEVAELSAWQPADRRRYILRLLGLDRVDRAVKKLQEDIRDMERDLRAREAALPSLEGIQAARQAAREKVALAAAQVEKTRAILQATEQELSVARERLEAMEVQQRQYAALERARDLARQALESARREASIHAERVRDLQDQKAQMDRLSPQLEPLESLRIQLQALVRAQEQEKHRASLRRRVADCRQVAEDLTAQVQFLQQQVSEYEKTQTAYEQVEAEVAQARERLVQVQGHIKENESRLAQIEQQRQKLLKNLDALKETGREAPCPVCRRPLSDSYDEALQHLESDLLTLQREQEAYSRFLKEDETKGAALRRALREQERYLQQLNGELRQLARAHATLQEKQRQLQRTAAELQKAQEELAAMGTVGYDPTVHQQVGAQVRTLERIEREVMRLRGAVERLPQEEAALCAAQQAIGQHEEALRLAEEKLATVPFDPAAFEAQRHLCRSLEVRQKAQAEEHQRATLERERALAEQQQADARRDDYDRQLGDIRVLRAEKENREALLHLMQAFRVDLIGRIRPALSAHTSSLVRDLTEGRYSQVELDEDYNLWMYDNGERREIAAFSGGENDLVHLCLRLAIAELISSSAGGAEHGFLVLDEVLGSQDGERRQLILTALARLSHRFRQILMITHLDDIKEMVEHVFELRETPNGSSILVAA